jgi:hypothetical protein
MNSVRAVSETGYESLKNYAIGLDSTFTQTFESYESNLPSRFAPSQQDAATQVT